MPVGLIWFGRIFHICFFIDHCVKSVQIRSFFWSVVSRIRTKYGEIRGISPYLVQIRENTDQKKLRIWTLFAQWILLCILLFLLWQGITSRWFFFVYLLWSCYCIQIKIILNMLFLSVCHMSLHLPENVFWVLVMFVINDFERFQFFLETFVFHFIFFQFINFGDKSVTN